MPFPLRSNALASEFLHQVWPESLTWEDPVVMWVSDSFPASPLPLTTMQFIWLLNISSRILLRIKRGWLVDDFSFRYNSRTMKVATLKRTSGFLL